MDEMTHWEQSGWHVVGGMLQHPDGYECEVSSLSSAGAILEWVYRLRQKSDLMIQFINVVDELTVDSTGRDLDAAYAPLASGDKTPRVSRVDLESGKIDIFDIAPD